MNENIINGLSVSMTLADVTKLAIDVKALEERVKAAEDAFSRERADFAAYKLAEDEREHKRLLRNEEALIQRLAVMAKNERKNTAYSEYLDDRAKIINEAWEFIRPKIGRVSKTKMLDYIERTNSAWEKFDKVQKECAK